MGWIRHLSLKIKLIILLVTLTGAMLATFATIAIRDFERDKIAYVLDSNLAQSRSTAKQIQTEVNFIYEKVKFLLRGYDGTQRTFHPYTRTNFQYEARLDALLSLALDESGSFKRFDTLLKPNLSEDSKNSIFLVAESLASSALENELVVFKKPEDSRWYIAFRLKLANTSPSVIVAALPSASFFGIFENAQMQDVYVVNDKNQIVMSPRSPTYNISTSSLNAGFQFASTKVAGEGVFSYPDPTLGETLVAVTAIGFGGLRVVSFVPRKAALETIRLMVLKSGLILGLLFFITVGLSVLTSATLTSSLKRLLAATREIAQGNFAVSVEVKSQDEIGALSSGFNKMTEEIQRLMSETAEKARMEGELKTAQLVQSTLFPKSHSRAEDLEIKGFYQPASECSGDWWYYNRIGDQTMFCIGDATGHGVPAALLTAAARSAASALETFPGLPLHEMMVVFNRAIYNTAHGQVMMTLFLGVYDHNTGIVSYCNASHEPPYLLPNKPGLKKKDLQILNAATGPRLGENQHSRYESATVQLNRGDKIVLYTDGVTELKNKSGEMFGERALIKLLLHCHNEEKSVVSTMETLAEEISTFRQDHPLQDDVTYFMVTRTHVA